MERSSGILMHISSLPSANGIGSFGKCAFDFVDFLNSSGQKYWQLLPLGPVGYGDSPYSSYSSFAGNPYFIDLGLLCEQGLLTEAEIKSFGWGDEPSLVDYNKLSENRFKVLKLAYARRNGALEEALDRFRAENEGWLEEYALYMALKEHFGMKGWSQWDDEEIRMHKPAALERYRERLKDSVGFHAFTQLLFFKQWEALRAYAHEKGLRIIGDMPIYVALDSCDVWSSPELFQLDDKYEPTQVAGVPPDAEREDGQRWGNPIYDWEKMRQQGYRWWVRRFEGASRLYDIVRIDHFRGFESYWSVPGSEKTARNGRWLPGPGMELISVLKAELKELEFIAEDLGYASPALAKFLADSGFPGMKVLQFGFGLGGGPAYLPENCGENSVCYIGTHDNDTTLGWIESHSAESQELIKKQTGYSETEGWCTALIRSGMSCASSLFIMQMQDLLELPGNCRMNRPGTTSGNWQWRMLPGAADAKLAAKLRKLTEEYNRI